MAIPYKFNSRLISDTFIVIMSGCYGCCGCIIVVAFVAVDDG
jgi:hypothetical protein